MDNGTRTRNIQLGKLTLCQLDYIRIAYILSQSVSECKGKKKKSTFHEDTFFSETISFLIS